MGNEMNELRYLDLKNALCTGLEVHFILTGRLIFQR